MVEMIKQNIILLFHVQISSFEVNMWWCYTCSLHKVNLIAISIPYLLAMLALIHPYKTKKQTLDTKMSLGWSNTFGIQGEIVCISGQTASLDWAWLWNSCLI